MTKRLPKMRGFNNRFKVEYTPINLDALDRLFEASADVNPESLTAAGLQGQLDAPIVVLARGEVTKPLSANAHRVSEKARQKLEAAGGTVEILPYEVSKRLPRS
jgi:large subunit ribosomal protein L15